MKSSYYSGLLVVFSWVIKMKNYMSKISDYCKKHWICIALLALVIGIIIFYRRTQFLDWLTINTGSVADWIGNVSIPIILAWLTFEYRSQKKQEKIQNEKNKVYGLILDLERINDDLEFTTMSKNVQEFQNKLANHIDGLKKMRDIVLYLNDNAIVKPVYSILGEIIDGSKVGIMDFNLAERYMSKLRDAKGILVKYYERLG